jgi:hypothetical protein
MLLGRFPAVAAVNFLDVLMAFAKSFRYRVCSVIVRFFPHGAIYPQNSLCDVHAMYQVAAADAVFLRPPLAPSCPRPGRTTPLKMTKYHSVFYASVAPTLLSAL